MTDWTERINALVGQDYVVLKDGTGCQEFIDLLYAEYTGGDNEVDNMPEQSDSLFRNYRLPLYRIAKQAGAKLIVELGVREARSSDSFLRAVGEGGRVISFDPAPIPNIMVSYSDRWEFNPLTGEEGYAKFSSGLAPDLLYIDTDPHDYPQAQSWLNTWASTVRKGGFIVMDDCNPQHSESVKDINYEGVWRVVRDYGVLHALLEYVDNNYNNIEYAFTVFNNHNNGFAVIKLGE